MTHYSNKQQLMLANAKRVYSEPLPLSAIFVLNDAAVALTGEGVAIEPLSGAMAAMAMVEAAFELDVDSRAAVQESFKKVTSIAQSAVPIFSLSYPRRFSLLPRVQASILEQVAA